METFRHTVERQLTTPGIRKSTAALAMIGVLRRTLHDLADREKDEYEAMRLRNLASCLPQWGA